MRVKGSRAPWSVPAAALLASALIAAAVLFCFDPSSHDFYPTCLFHKATGLYCPGCGSLRALHQLLHGHVSAAFRFNPLLIVMLPVSLWFVCLSFRRMIRNQPPPGSFSVKWIWIFVGIGVLFTIWRNLPGSPFAMLPR
jgi:hypothetical protein